MKTNIIKIFFFSLLLITAFSQAQQLRSLTNNAFKKGEVITYRVHYGFIDAGTARLEVLNEEKKYGDRDAFHIVGTGKSRGAFDWFFKVRDRYETFIDDQAIVPWLFVRRVDEGGYHINQNVSFNHIQNTATSEKKTIPTPENVQDLVSSYYYARTIDFSNAKENDLFSFDAYLDDEVIPMKIKYVGKEKIRTKLGTFNCIKFHPQLFVGRVFKDQEDMTIWISDDKNKVIIRAEAEVVVCSVKMDLQEYSNLANALDSQLK